MRKVLYGLVVPLLAVASLGAAIWFSGRSVDELQDLEPSPVPVGAAVAVGEVDFNAAATLTVAPDAASPILSPGLPGIITEVLVQPGQEVSPGQVLYRVDGVAVMAYGGETVLFRDLALGARGPDVEALQEFLIEILPGQELDVDGVYGAGTAAAVREWEESIGLSRTTGSFRLELLAFVPADTFVVDEVLLELGAPAPERASAVFEARPSVGETRLTTESSGPLGAYEFVYSGRAALVERTDDGWEIAPDELPELLPATLSPDEPTVLEGRLRLIDAAPAQIVPGGAVITDTQGATCVALIDGTTYSLATVDLLGAQSSGHALIAPDLPDGTEVLINPYQILGEVSCVP